MKRLVVSSRRIESCVAAHLLRIGCAVLFLYASTWTCSSQDAASSNSNQPKLDVVRLSEILIKTPQPYDPAQVEEARHKAEEMLESLHQGKEFAGLAKTYSDGPSAASGGNVGYFAHGDLAQPLEEVVWKMKVGDVSGVIRTKQGFVILRVTDRSDSAAIRSATQKADNPDEVPAELKPYVEALVKAVKHQWYLLGSFLPQNKAGYFGELAIQFTVQRDGTVTAMKFLSDSGDRDLDKAAWEAVRQTSPFSRFPEAAKVDHVVVRVNFRYKEKE